MLLCKHVLVMYIGSCLSILDVVEPVLPRSVIARDVRIREASYVGVLRFGQYATFFDFAQILKTLLGVALGPHRARSSAASIACDSHRACATPHIRATGPS